MALEVSFIRTLRGLEPADDEAREALKTWKLGEKIKGVFRVTRDNGRLRWYWKLCQIIADNSERWPTKEAASDTLKMGCGVFTEFQVKGKDGEWYVLRQPGSIAFGNKEMTEPAFRAFCLRAQNYAATEMLQCEPDDLAQALDEYLNPDSRRAA